jgi:hypothetical protein
VVNKIRNALRGFLLLPGGQNQVSVVETGSPPYLSNEVIVRSSALRGYSEKQNKSRLMVLPGKHSADVFRYLHDVVVRGENAPKSAKLSGGANLVVFRGVFGSGGYSLEVKNVRREGDTLFVECDYENPGEGIRTTSGFTQPAAMIPLANLSAGKYTARLIVRELCRSARGVSETAASREILSLRFRVEE